MEAKVVKFGTGMHICVKRIDGFSVGQTVEINKPNEGLTKEEVKEIIKEEIEKVRNY